jgi:hypothetical protein
VRELKTIMDYVDSKIRKLQDEIEHLQMLREFLEYRIKKLSIEPSNTELPAILSEANWRRYPSGEGEWCFADELPRNFIEELKRKGSKTLNGYRYLYKKLSGGKEVVSRRVLNGFKTVG